MVSIRGYGAYVPRYRIERTAIAEQHGSHASGGETAVPAHDENVITLAVSAAKNALAHADGENGVDAVYTATTTDPFDERGVAAHVTTAVGAGVETRVSDFQGSARATTNALLAARDTIEAGHSERVLVVATDALSAPSGSAAEQTAGAGAAALVLDAERGMATLDDTGIGTTGFVGRFKRTNSGPQTGDARFNRERYIDAVTDAIDHVGDGLTPDRAALAAPDDRWGNRALRAAALDAKRASTFDAVGYAGAASVLLDLTLAFDDADSGETVLLVGYGPGGADALAMRTEDCVDPPEPTVREHLDSKEYVTYAKHRSYREHGGVA